MTIQEILDLGKMGYTKEDIEKMGDEKQEPEKKEPEKQEPEKKEPEKKEPEKKDPEPGNVDTIAQLTESINSLIASIQTANILKTNNHSGEDESAEEILGSIIMPPLKKGEKTK